METRNDRTPEAPQAHQLASFRRLPAAPACLGSILALLLFAASGAVAGERAKPPGAPPADPRAELMAAPPFAVLQLSRNTVSLPFPSIGGPVQSASVDFIIVGNARATLTAEPAQAFSVGGRVLGKAVNGGEVIGYDVILAFQKEKRKKRPDRQKRRTGGPMSSATADLLAGGLESRGTISVVTDPEWTPNGGIPLPGNYVGEIILTLTADH